MKSSWWISLPQPFQTICIFGLQNTFYIAHNYIADTAFKVIFVQTFYIISFGLQVLVLIENIIHHLFPEWQYHCTHSVKGRFFLPFFALTNTELFCQVHVLKFRMVKLSCCCNKSWFSLSTHPFSLLLWTWSFACCTNWFFSNHLSQCIVCTISDSLVTAETPG